MGVSVPRPVEVGTGRVVSLPPIMTGWDGYTIPDRVREHLGPVPVVVNNDATAMLGERQRRPPGVDNLVYVKVGTGVGVGIVAIGQLLRGARGSAGDLGRDRPPGRRATTVPVRQGRLCRGLLQRMGAGSRPSGRVSVPRYPGRRRPRRDGQSPRATTGPRERAHPRGGCRRSRQPPQSLGGRHRRPAQRHGSAPARRERVAGRSLPLAVEQLLIETSALNGDNGVIGLAHAVGDAIFGRPSGPLS